MLIHCFQHVAHEGPGTIAEWAAERGYPLLSHRVDLCVPPPPGEDEALVVLGGPMGVHDQARHPWLAAEKAAIADWIRAERPVLGICLGAQLIAHVLGAQVGRNPSREIGWFPIRWLPELASTPLKGLFEGEQEVLHWHGDTFALPEGALPIAESRACANQGFVYGRRVIGLQFHLEADMAMVEAFIGNGGLPAPERWVQSEAELRAGSERAAALRGSLFALLDAWIEL